MLDMTLHIAQYSNIIADLRDEIRRLRQKLDQQKHGAATTVTGGINVNLAKPHILYADIYYWLARWASIVLLAGVCLRLSSSVTLPVCGPASRQARGNAAWERCRRSGWPGAWTVGAPAAGCVGSRAAYTARRASTVTSR